MKKKQIGTYILAPCVMLILSQVVFGNLISNSSFETEELIHGMPTTFRDWGGDLSHVVTAENSVAPHSGNHMMRFDETNLIGTNGAWADAWQFIDIGEYSEAIATGSAEVEASVFFNRILGDSETDTRMWLGIKAFEGDLSTLNFNNPIIHERNWLTTDGDVNTWEQVTITVTLPTNTDYIAIMLSTEENVSEDIPPEIQIDGHYADDVLVTIVPEPATLSLLSLGALTLLRKRKA